MTVRSQSPQDTNETIKYWRGLKVLEEPKKNNQITKKSESSRYYNGGNNQITEKSQRARDTNETIK